MNVEYPYTLPKWKYAIKSSIDFSLAFVGLAFTWWIILIAAVLATIDTGKNGFFTQVRVGKDGKPFKVIKIRTMKDSKSITTTVTSDSDPRITRLGKFFRKTKIDELPQLVNVLLCQMSFVGPRPDVPGYIDLLKGDDVVVMSLRPGITGPATLFYRNEERLLAEQKDPIRYNNEVIFPHKVKINKKYILEYSILKDFKYIFNTVLGDKFC